MVKRVAMVILYVAALGTCATWEAVNVFQSAHILGKVN